MPLRNTGKRNKILFVDPQALVVLENLPCMYQFPAGISVGAGVRYIGKQWADDANTARLPSVTLMDAMMRADLGVWSPTLKGAYVQVNANNIGDREYISGCYGTGNCYWGAERSVIATVGYDF